VGHLEDLVDWSEAWITMAQSSVN